MTAVHPSHQNPAASDTRPGSSSGFSFPRSGLGTPDFFYLAGSGESSTTPSWFKQPRPADVVKLEEEDDLDQETSGSSRSNSNTKISKMSPFSPKLPDTEEGEGEFRPFPLSVSLTCPSGPLSSFENESFFRPANQANTYLDHKQVQPRSRTQSI